MRFIALYFTCWVLLGTALAVAGASVGPVFYDALVGGDRFEADSSPLSDANRTFAASIRMLP